MSDEQNDDIFDVDRVRNLVELMIEHGLTEVDLRQHGQTIRLRRGGEQSAELPVAPAVIPAAISAPQSALAADDADLYIVNSPMVGTFYSRPNPESDAFVQVGQDISADTTVCIIEAMKVFNEIAAEVAGKIVAVLVDDEEPVEFGKPLFKVRPHI
jgi:acetyl-CoA carboxylase biotin carboxyl carrier protein